MITHQNNFCRVFELPDEYPKGFLFGGGRPVAFMMVDWFQPIPVEDIYNNEIKKWEEYVPRLRGFLEGKVYRKPGKQYVLLTDFGEAMFL